MSGRGVRSSGFGRRASGLGCRASGFGLSIYGYGMNGHMPYVQPAARDLGLQIQQDVGRGGEGRGERAAG